MRKKSADSGADSGRRSRPRRCGARPARAARRGLRWVGAAAVVMALWACNSPRLSPPTEPPQSVSRHTFVQSVNRKLDLLFMVDNSQSMDGSQAKLAQRLPDFLNVFINAPEGLPDLHLAVISSSLGAGRFGNAPRSACAGGHPMDDNGAFQVINACPGLNAGERFIKAGGGANNFTGDIATLFRCMALLGANGCGFEQQLESTRFALQKAADPRDPDNAGFLRDDAILGVIMLTNEDDCSVPFDSDLLDPSQNALASPLGGYQSYRCNEFGHLCDGKAPPHQVGGPTTLQNCAPAEGQGRLTPVADFVAFFKKLKADPRQVFLAALTGKPTSYVVEMQKFPGVVELQPAVQHACVGSSPMEWADPAVRIQAFIDAFGPNGVLDSICDDDYRSSMNAIAAAINLALAPACIADAIRLRPGTDVPDCQVTEMGISGPGPGVAVPFCGPGPTQFPCWRLQDDARCPGAKVLRICRESTCDPSQVPPDPRQAQISCSIEQP